MTSPAPVALGAIASAATLSARAQAMVRLAAAVAGILGALAPLSLAAVGLGPITQQSALGASLRVVVPVTLAAGEDVPSECFKLAPAQRDADGIPQILFGRVAVERTPSGTQLVVTSARPVNDPVVRVTIQAGCEISMRREYTLFMDPPAIETPVVAAESAPREAVAAPQPPPAARGSARAAGTPARVAKRGAAASGSGDGAGAARKAAPPKARAAAKPAPKRPPAVAADRPRLTVSRAPPDGGAGAATGTPTEADRERAQQELANSIEAETVILRQRIVELTAMVERMQQEVQAQETAQRAAEAAAKAPPPVPEPDWWEANASLLAAIVGMPLLIAAGLLWNRRRDATREGHWRPTRAPARPAPGAREARQPAPVLRNAPAGLAQAGPEIAAPAPEHPIPSGLPAAAGAGDALAVSELSQVTEEARVYAELGHHDRAIEVLQEHIRQLPRSMPAAWLMLLDLYHATDRRQEFRKLAEDFHLHFNVQTPVWEGFAPDDPGSDGLAAFPHILKQVADLWRKPECRTYLERLLNDNREGRRTGFPLATYADILTLLQVLDAPEPVDIDLDLVDDGKLDLPPRAPARAPRPARGDARGPGAGAKADAAGSIGIDAPGAATHQVRARPGAGGARRRRQAAVVAGRHRPRRARQVRTPFSRWITRCAFSAAFGSCVTMTIVLPTSRFSRSSRPRISSAVVRSRSPVGSSATMSVGSPMSARAIATRCCWPPESSFG